VSAVLAGLSRIFPVGPVVTGHLLLLKVSTDEIVTRGNLEIKSFLRKSSLLTGSARMTARNRRWRRQGAIMSTTPIQQTNRLDRRKGSDACGSHPG